MLQQVLDGDVFGERVFPHLIFEQFAPIWLQLSKMLQTWQVLGRRENPSRHCCYVCLVTVVSCVFRLQPLKGRLCVAVVAAGTPAASSSSNST